MFHLALAGFEPRSFGSRVRRSLYQLSHPVTDSERGQGRADVWYYRLYGYMSGTRVAVWLYRCTGVW